MSKKVNRQLEYLAIALSLCFFIFVGHIYYFIYLDSNFLIGAVYAIAALVTISLVIKIILSLLE